MLLQRHRSDSRVHPGPVARDHKKKSTNSHLQQFPIPHEVLNNQPSGVTFVDEVSSYNISQDKNMTNYSRSNFSGAPYLATNEDSNEDDFLMNLLSDLPPASAPEQEGHHSSFSIPPHHNQEHVWIEASAHSEKNVDQYSQLGAQPSPVQHHASVSGQKWTDNGFLQSQEPMYTLGLTNSRFSRRTNSTLSAPARICGAINSPASPFDSSNYHAPNLPEDNFSVHDNHFDSMHNEYHSWQAEVPVKQFPRYVDLLPHQPQSSTNPAASSPPPFYPARPKAFGWGPPSDFGGMVANPPPPLQSHKPASTSSVASSATMSVASSSSSISPTCSSDRTVKQTVQSSHRDAPKRNKKKTAIEEGFRTSNLTSLEVFLSFVRTHEDTQGNMIMDTTGMLSRQCFEKWMSSRRRRPRYPEECFRKTIISHVTVSDKASLSFPKNIEESLLKELRKKKIWPCFVDRCYEGTNRPINIGLKGLRAKGFHERQKNQVVASRTTSYQSTGKRSFSDDQLSSPGSLDEEDQSLDGDFFSTKRQRSGVLTSSQSLPSLRLGHYEGQE